MCVLISPRLSVICTCLSCCNASGGWFGSNPPEQPALKAGLSKDGAICTFCKTELMKVTVRAGRVCWKMHGQHELGSFPLTVQESFDAYGLGSQVAQAPQCQNPSGFSQLPDLSIPLGTLWLRHWEPFGSKRLLRLWGRCLQVTSSRRPSFCIHVCRMGGLLNERIIGSLS